MKDGSHNVQQARTAPKVSPIYVPKSSSSKSKPLAKVTGDIYNVEEEKDMAANGGESTKNKCMVP